MYYLITCHNTHKFLQFQDINDRRSTDWTTAFPTWDESSHKYFGRSNADIIWDEYTILVTSPTPIAADSYPELSI